MSRSARRGSGGGCRSNRSRRGGCGRSLLASVISVRAKSQREKSLRRQCWTKQSSGTSAMSVSSVRRLAARAISLPSGRRKTKSPNPSCSRKKACTSSCRVGESLCAKRAGMAFARADVGGVRAGEQQRDVEALLLDAREEVHPGARVGPALAREAHVGDDPQDVRFVAVEESHGAFVVLGHEDLRPRAHREQPVLLVQALLEQRLGSATPLPCRAAAGARRCRPASPPRAGSPGSRPRRCRGPRSGGLRRS